MDWSLLKSKYKAVIVMIVGMEGKVVTSEIAAACDGKSTLALQGTSFSNPPNKSHLLFC